jgi:hypothetical protein
MRAILLTLALLNLLFLAWATWIDTPLAGSAPARGLPALNVLAARSAPPPKAAVAAPELRCATLGPMPDVASATSVQAALAARQLGVSGRQSVGEELEGYWVRVEHLADEAARKRATQRLERAGVRGVVPLSDPGQLSAGLFADQAAADKRAALVRTAGYQPVVEPRNRAVTQFWIDVQVPLDLPLPAVDALTESLLLPMPPSWGNCPARP